jgi:hypothetical protein
MVGLIWFVQVVHYPLFDRVREQDFAAFEIDHSRRTSFVVVPLMLGELGTGLWLVMVRADWFATWLGLILLVLVWLSTFLLQVPRHRLLSTGFHEQAHRQLVATNWIRTVGWTLRGVLVLGMLLEAKR